MEPVARTIPTRGPTPPATCEALLDWRWSFLLRELPLSFLTLRNHDKTSVIVAEAATDKPVTCNADCIEGDVPEAGLRSVPLIIAKTSRNKYGFVGEVPPARSGHRRSRLRRRGGVRLSLDPARAGDCRRVSARPQALRLAGGRDWLDWTVPVRGRVLSWQGPRNHRCRHRHGAGLHLRVGHVDRRFADLHVPVRRRRHRWRQLDRADALGAERFRLAGYPQRRACPRDMLPWGDDMKQCVQEHGRLEPLPRCFEPADVRVRLFARRRHRDPLFARRGHNADPRQSTR